MFAKLFLYNHSLIFEREKHDVFCTFIRYLTSCRLLFNMYEKKTRYIQHRCTRMYSSIYIVARGLLQGAMGAVERALVAHPAAVWSWSEDHVPPAIECIPHGIGWTRWTCKRNIGKSQSLFCIHCLFYFSFTCYIQAICTFIPYLFIVYAFSKILKCVGNVC